MRVLVAPDKFRGTLTASQAVEAMAAGWLRARPGDEIDRCPVADGGEGTMAALVGALGGERSVVRVAGPLGSPVEAALGMVDAGGERAAIVESAAASGVALLIASGRDALRATTTGTGELLRAALDREPDRVLLCVGGTASTDGGVGAAAALGVRFLRADGSPVAPGGLGLLELATVDLTLLDGRLRRVAIDACVDVDNPLTGPTGASATFAPQKGASPDDVVLLDRALRHLAAVVHRDLGVDLHELPGSGAGGGLAFGAAAFLGARIRSGARLVLEALGLEARVRLADVVITGEGRFDRGSLGGKAPVEVIRLAREHGRAPIVVCGEAEAGVEGRVDGIGAVVSLVDRFGPDAATADATRCLREVAAALAAGVEETGTG
jgi:glycerate kinase